MSSLNTTRRAVRVVCESLEGRQLFATTLPVSSGLMLWLDASAVNGSAANPANGAAVSSWKDLSGKNHHATAASAGPIFKTSGINGKPSIDLTNASDLGFVVPESADFSSTNSTIFAVYNPVSGSYFSTVIGVSPTGTYNNEMMSGFAWGTNFPKAPIAFHHTSAGSYKFRSAPTMTGTTPLIQTTVFGTAVDDTANIVNGTTSAVALGVSGSPQPYTTVNRAVYIGRRGVVSSSEFFNGQLAELIYFNRKLTTAEQNQIGGYLETKYGIASAYTPTSEANVTGKGVSIIDGDTVAATSDDTDFGSTALGAAVSKTFTVKNFGSAALTTSGLIVPAGFTVTEGLSASIAAGGQDTFTVRLNATAAGTFTGNLSFANNDGNENPYNFTIKGIVNPAAPEADVFGNNVAITDGDTTPSTTDFTDFGAVNVGSPLTRTFTVKNTGASALTTSGLTVPAGFAIDATDTLLASIPAGGSDTFKVKLSATNAGLYSGNISFANNDANENPYNFSIKGAVNSPTFAFSNNTITVTGTSGADFIRGSIAGGILTLKVNALVATYNPGSSITKIIVNALAGNDNISLAPSVNIATSLNGGDNDDIIYGGTGINTINGGNGNDTAFKHSSDVISLVEDILV